MNRKGMSDVLSHEGEARETHPKASDFRPATRLGKVIGWTFHVPRDPSKDLNHDGYSWMDLEGDVTSDTFNTRHEAQGVLRGYLRMKRQAPVNPLEKRA